MSKLQWGVFVAIVGIVLITQLPHHDHDDMAGHSHDSHALTAAAENGETTVTLAVSGMT